MHSYYLHNYLTFFYMYSVMVFLSVPIGPRPVYDLDVVEPKIPTNPIVEFFEKENNDLKAKLKRSDNLHLQCIEGKMKLELDLADVVDKHKINMYEMHLKIRKIRKYAIHKYVWYHYAVGSIINLVVILIAFVVRFKFFR